MIFQSQCRDQLSPTYWRERARQAEVTAADASPPNRRILQDVACSYHEMADLMEVHHRFERSDHNGLEGGQTIHAHLARLERVR